MNIMRNTKAWRTIAIARSTVVIAVALWIAQPAITFAGDACSHEGVQSSKIACGIGRSPCCCPDDYVCKPAPCVCAVQSCCPDTYCPKPWLNLPCPTKCCCTDDYCPKPIPSLCRPLSNIWYKCVASPPCLWLKPVTCTGQRD